jgi:hypothetical protein
VAPTVLWTFDPHGSPAARDAGQLARASAGLVHAVPESRDWDDPRMAALALAEEGLAIWPAEDGVPIRRGDAGAVEAQTLASLTTLMDDFRGRFPGGIAYDTGVRPPAALIALHSRVRLEIYRAALLFARGLRRGHGPEHFEVTAAVAEGSLRAIFVVDRSEPSGKRRAWRHLVRAWTVRAAAGVPLTVGMGDKRQRTDPAGNEAPML